MIFSISLVIFIIKIITAAENFPRILTETHNETLNLSSTATLTCHVRDLGDHHVTWFKIDPYTSQSSPLAVGKQLFTTDKRYSISFYSTSYRESFWSLEIYELNLDDEGTYVCKIANRRARVSIYINLHIQMPMILYPTRVYTEPNRTIQLNCSLLFLSDDYAKITNKSMIKWHFLSHRLNRTKITDIHIKKSSKENMLTSILIIHHAQTYHTGSWTCAYRSQRQTTKVIVEKGNEI